MQPCLIADHTRFHRAADLTNAIATTSANSNTVMTLGLSADGSYNQAQLQEVINRLDELITALRR